MDGWRLPPASGVRNFTGIPGRQHCPARPTPRWPIVNSGPNTARRHADRHRLTSTGERRNYRVAAQVAALSIYVGETSDEARCRNTAAGPPIWRCEE